MGTTASFITIIILLAANGFFVAAEFALVKAKTVRIEGLAEQGKVTAKMTVRIQQNLEAYLAACQLGITMASLGLGWIGEPAVAALLKPLFESLAMSESIQHTASFVIGFLIFSSLHIVVGEQLPKTIAIRKAEPVSLWVAYPLHLSYLAVYPLNWLLNKATNSLLKLFGVEEATHGDVFTSDELQDLVKMSQVHGELHEDKANMLHNLFEFDQQLVGRVMIPRNAVEHLDLAATPEHNLMTIKTSGHSRFPVINSVKGNTISGIVLVKEIYNAVLDGAETPWKDLTAYTRTPLVVPESQRASKLFDMMRQQREHMAFVVDEYGAYIGIVTLEDLLEEIVGEINDETDDIELPYTVALSDNKWAVDGLVSLNDLSREIGIVFPDSIASNTLSGLFMEQLGCMPEPKNKIQIGDYCLRIKSIISRRVGQVIISLEPEDNNEPNETIAIEEKPAS